METVRVDQGDKEFRTIRGRQIKAAMEAKRWTQTELARKIGYSVRTLRKLLKGEAVRPNIILDACQALGVSPMKSGTSQDDRLADELSGSYTRSQFSDYEGHYFLFRRDLHSPENLHRASLSIWWGQKGLEFSEQYRNSGDPNDCCFFGDVYISNYTGLIHLLTIRRGAVRVLTLTKMRRSNRIMRGMVATQTERVDFFQPSVAAVFLIKSEEATPASFTDIQADHPDYAFAMTEICITEQQVVNFCMRQ